MPNEWNLSSTEDGVSLLLNWNEDGPDKRHASPLRIRGMKSPSTRRRDQQRMQAYLIRQKDQKVSDCHENAPQVSAKSTVQQPDRLPVVVSSISRRNQTFQANMSVQSVPTTASIGVQCNIKAETATNSTQCVSENISCGVQCSPETVSHSVQCATEKASVAVQCKQGTVSTSVQGEMNGSSDADSQPEPTSQSLSSHVIQPSRKGIQDSL